METRFQVRSTSSLPDRKRFLILGETLDGSIRPGMKIFVALNNSIKVHATVAGVETVRKEGACEAGLSIDCGSEEELQMWIGLNIEGGEILRLTDS